MFWRFGISKKISIDSNLRIALHFVGTSNLFDNLSLVDHY